jgi:hypothetical protein
VQWVEREVSEGGSERERRGEKGVQHSSGVKLLVWKIALTVTVLLWVARVTLSFTPTTPAAGLPVSPCCSLSVSEWGLCLSLEGWGATQHPGWLSSGAVHPVLSCWY